jgi:hypothetical protein
MPKVKLVMMTCIAALAFSALASASASAATPGWMVNGKLLAHGESAKFSPNTTVLENFQLTAAGVTVTCETLKVKNGSITGLTLALAESLEFGQCKANNNCAVEENISTVPILTHEVTLDGTLAAKATFIPETKTTFATINFTNPLCALLGVQPVTGKATVLAPTLQDERVTQQININSSGELKVGSSAATLKGIADFKLENGLPWSFL